MAMLPLVVWSQGWPANYSGVMMQGFVWDDYTTTTWSVLTNNVEEYSKWFDLIWVPQSGQIKPNEWNYGDGARSMGYSPVYMLRHNSCFGTQAQLINMIKVYREHGTGIIEDVVVNHKNGVYDWADFPNETATGPTTGRSYSITWASPKKNMWGICTSDEVFGQSGYTASSDAHGDTGDDFDGARDLDHQDSRVRANIKTYLDYLVNELGYAGFRWDMVKGFDPKYVAEYVTSSTPMFSVGECWDGMERITNYIKGSYYKSAAFDFPLMYAIKDACRNGSWGSLNNAGLVADANLRRYAVTFIDNHDTYRNDRLITNTDAAYAFILGMPGTPCILKDDYTNSSLQPVIQACIRGRRAAGVTNQSNITNVEQKNGGITFWVAGSKGNVCIQLGPDTDNGCPSGYKDVWHKDGLFRYSVETELDPYVLQPKETSLLGEAMVDKGSGNYTGSVTVKIRPSVMGTTLVFTTDGSTPSASSAQITGVKELTFSENTTLKVGVLNNGKVQQVKIFKYVITSSDNGKIRVYVRGTNIHVYAWDSEGIVSSAWPGSKLNNSIGIGGLDWSYIDFTKKSDDYAVNLILNEGDGDTQTADITGVTHDIFLSLSSNQYEDLTTSYIESAKTPSVSIDKTSGEYEVNTLSVSLSASATDAQIVYTTNGSVPTATNGTKVTGKATLSLNKSTSEQVVNAGILVNGTVTNVVTRVYLVKGGTQGSTTTTKGITIYVYKDAGTPNCYLYSWNSSGTKRTGAWPGKKFSTMQTEQINGGTWYYYTFPEADKSINIIFNNGNGAQTADITGVTTDRYYYYPSEFGTDYTKAYQETGSEYVNRNQGGDDSGTTTALPSDAKWLDGHVFCYFENDGNYTIPYIWAWSDTENFTGGSWPGTQLVEPVGISPNGNTIFLWDLGEAESAPTGVLFSDKSGVGTQTSDFTFVNGGYYTTSGSAGSVSGNGMTLASVLKSGVQGKNYVVDDDLRGVCFSPDGQYLYAKDNGNANEKYANTDGLKPFDNPEDFDQSNWVVIKFKSVQSAAKQQAYINHTIKSGTLSGTLANKNNAVINAVVTPVAGESVGEYEPNTYCVANFVPQSEYFLMTPRVNEYAKVREAVYKDGAFYVPARSSVENMDKLSGGVSADLAWYEDGPTFENGKVYAITGVIKPKNGSSSAPRKVAINEGELSSSFVLSAISAVETEQIITGVAEDKLAEKEVQSTEYYNLLGIKSNEPFEGVNIKVVTYTDGTRKVVKTIAK